MTKARKLSKLPNYILSTIAELKLTVGKTQGDKAFAGGYYADGDGGGGDFYWDAVSVETDNGGTILQVTGVTTGRWKRINSGTVNVKWFGAKGDGVTDDATPIRNSCSTTKNVFFPDGLFLYNSNNPSILNNNQYIIGSGINNTIIKTGTDIAGSFCVFKGTSISNSGISNLTIDGNSTINGVATGGNRSLFSFQSSNYISVENIKLINYGQKEYGSIALEYANTAIFGACSNITINNITLKDCKTEGLGFINCTDISIDGFSAYCPLIGTPLGIVSLLAPTDSKDIRLNNIYIDGSIGSAINCLASNVNANMITIKNFGSSAIDCSNEVLPVGTYFSNHLWNNLYISGNGTTSYSGIVTYTSCFKISNSIIEKCEQGIYIGDTTVGFGITKDVTLNNVTIKNLSNTPTGGVTPYGVLIRNADTVILSDVLISTVGASGEGVGIDAINASNLKIKDSKIEECHQYCMNVKQVSYVNITSSTFISKAIGSTLSQIHSYDTVQDDSSYIWLTDNVFKGSTNSYAVLLDKSKNIYIKGNINQNTGASKRLVYLDVNTIFNLSHDDTSASYRNPTFVGNAFIWSTDAGKLMIKTTRPTTESDGTIVGTQV